MRLFYGLVFGLYTFTLCSYVAGAEDVKVKIPAQATKAPESPASFPVKRNIVTTYFWIGQGGTSISDTTNIKSAWDSFWKKNFGGIDCLPEESAKVGLLVG